MKKIVIIFVIIHFCFSSQSQQKTFSYPVLLFPLVEYTVIKVNGEKKNLDSALACSVNDQINIVKGKVSVLNSNGDETIFDTGKKFSVKEKTNQDNGRMHSSIDKLSKFMDSPSVYLPNLYNNERNKYVIFPVKSRVCDRLNIKFQLSQDAVSGMKFVLYFKETDSLIWQTDNFANDLSLKKAPLETGKAYSWRLYNGSNSVKGEFELLTKNQIKKITAKSLKDKKDYLKAFFTYLENECRFDAVAVLNDAITKYPESGMFKGLQLMIPMDTNEQ